MEYSLRPAADFKDGLFGTVLILILMEYSLRQQNL